MKYNKNDKLDLKTLLYLYITKVVIIDHAPVEKINEKRTMYFKNWQENEAYIFKNFDEYKKFFLMYLDDVDDDLIKLAIYTKGSKGQIVAFKGLCERIIVKKKVNDFYNSITQEQIDAIHSKGKLTPLEAVQLWESLDLCIEGNKMVFSKNRCKYFDYNCHDCLMETASHQLEHEPVNFELDNSINNKTKQEYVKTLKP